jgi:hypothetical protein
MRGRFAVVVAVLTGLMFASVVTAAAAGASPVVHDNTAAVCTATGKTVSNGLKGFVADMQKARSEATSGDLTGAQTSVKQGGEKLTAIGVQLRKDAAGADSQQLKTAVTDLAAEFGNLGGALKDLTSFQGFNTAKLQRLANHLGDLCGVPASGRVPFPTQTS